MKGYYKTFEADLWRGIIRQLIYDCQRSADGLTFYSYNEYFNGNQKREITELQVRQRERNSLLNDLHGEWVKEICDYAGIDYKKLLTKCYDILEGRDEYRYHRSKRSPELTDTNYEGPGRAFRNKRRR